MSEVPRVLIVTNNCLSWTSNNGKTIKSFFQGWPSTRLAQLYFSSELPESQTVDQSYRISDRDALESIFRLKKRVGGRVHAVASEFDSRPIRRHGKTVEIQRLVRECVWFLALVRERESLEWARGWRPDLIFFCAGDCLFAYRLVARIARSLSIPVVIFITDDYVLPRPSESLVARIRRKLIRWEQGRFWNRAAGRVSISQQMSEEYERLYGMQSIWTAQVPPSHRTLRPRETATDDCIRFVYAGSLHYGRSEPLALLARTVGDLGLAGHRVELEIYSGQAATGGLGQALAAFSNATHKGLVGSEELDRILVRADVLVHVESFDPAQQAATRLSVSTKIPEYLSYEKPILAIGPAGIASMKLLEGSAECVNDLASLRSSVEKLVKTPQVRDRLANEASNKLEWLRDESKRNSVEDLIFSTVARPH